MLIDPSIYGTVETTETGLYRAVVVDKVTGREWFANRKRYADKNEALDVATKAANDAATPDYMM